MKKVINLDFIRKKNIKESIEKILHNSNPSHNQRLWLVGFLYYCKLNKEQISKFIADNNQWTDYNPKITSYQIESFFKNKSKIVSSHKPSS